MHPQGGSHPTDIGTINAREEKKIDVTNVTVDRDSGVVTHQGKGTTPFLVSEEVKVSVDLVS